MVLFIAFYDALSSLDHDKDQVLGAKGLKKLLNFQIFGCLHDFGVEKMIVGHCTGFHATVALVREFGDKISTNTVGHVIEF